MCPCIINPKRYRIKLMRKSELRTAAAILGSNGGKIGGKSKSRAKIAAARRNGLIWPKNGKKKGRPPKNKSGKISCLDPLQ